MSDQIELDAAEGAAADKWLAEQGVEWNTDPTRPDVQSTQRLRDLSRREIDFVPGVDGDGDDDEIPHEERFNVVVTRLHAAGGGQITTDWPETPPKSGGKALGYKAKTRPIPTTQRRSIPTK
jgi:hypothetical protein